jgi:TetR/AcrR family transcriptional repressor of nem operon
MRAGRPKEFVEEDALEKAMDLFWLHGFNGIGLSDLLRGMGIARQSLYNTFGNKRDLFIRSIGHYEQTRLRIALELLEQSPSPLEGVKGVMKFFRDLALDKQCRGCFVANALVEMAPHDPKIVTLLRKTLARLERSLAASLERARCLGELPKSKPPAPLAKALINALIGMAVTGKLKPGRAAVNDIYAGTLSMLE